MLNITIITYKCSSLVDNFLNTDKENRLVAVVTGFRKLEFVLVVQAEFTGRMKKQNIATTLHQELKEKKEKYRGHVELISVEYNGKMCPSILQWNICAFVILLSYLYMPQIRPAFPSDMCGAYSWSAPT